jgi:hypothetical protein
LKIVGPFGHMNERHDNCLVIEVFMYNSKISEGNGAEALNYGVYLDQFSRKSPYKFGFKV